MTSDDAIWSVAIAPRPSVALRLPPNHARLQELVERHAVALRGWNYPHVSHGNSGETRALPDGGIEGIVNWARYREVWRLHPNGLFTHKWRMREDGTESYAGGISIVAAIYSVVEIFEFGRRLYQDDQTVEDVVFDVRLEGVLGRRIVATDFHDLPYGQAATSNSVRREVVVPRVDLQIGILSPAVQTAHNLFGQLGFMTISEAFINEKASRFLQGRI